MSLRCFIQTQAPIPGSTAQPVRYPACEWLDDDGSVHPQHPMNRFVCSWLTSDITSVERCQEVLDAMAQIDAGQLSQWFADGDAFCVDFSAGGVQFNQSNVGPEMTAWWNMPQGHFSNVCVASMVHEWLSFLVKFNS
jgi:hypothetical protein